MHPHLIHISGSLNINSYGVMIVLGFLLFYYFSYNNPKREKLISGEKYINLIFLGLLTGIIGGRLYFVLENLDQFKNNFLEIFYPWVGGFCLLGSIISLIIIFPIYLRINKIKILPVLDLISIYVPLLQSIARVGCFLAGCCYGCNADKDLLWSVIFTNPDSLAPTGIYLHPTQLYSTVLSFIIFIILYFISKFKTKTGLLFFLYLTLESSARFTVDFWRGERDYINLNFLPIWLSISQLVSIILFGVSIFGLIFIFLKKDDSI